MTRNPKSLPPGTKLDVYVIKATIGTGGFSIVYTACNPEGETVLIKEYMPRQCASRLEDLTVTLTDTAQNDHFYQGRALFFQEASTLAMLRHPNIVRVTNFFSAHETVYMVMEYHKGENLQSYIKKRGRGLSEQFLRTVFPPLLDGLAEVHAQGLLHLDIKPSNIHLRPGGKPLLLDFGAAHQILRSRQGQSGQVVSSGYSPVEQHKPKGYVGPWSDIYAMGATMRACIEGKRIQPAPDRYVADKLAPVASLYKKSYSPALLRAIDWAMEIDPLLRPQSVAEFLDAFDTVEELGADKPLLTRLSDHIWGGSD